MTFVAEPDGGSPESYRLRSKSNETGNQIGHAIGEVIGEWSRQQNGKVADQLAGNIQQNADTALKDPANKGALAALHRDSQELNGNLKLENGNLVQTTNKDLQNSVQKDLNALEAKGHLPPVTIDESGQIGATGNGRELLADPSQPTQVWKPDQFPTAPPVSGDDSPISGFTPITFNPQWTSKNAQHALSELAKDPHSYLSIHLGGPTTELWGEPWYEIDQDVPSHAGAD